MLLLGFFRQSSNSPLGSCSSHYINLLLVVKNAFWYFRCWKVIFSCTIFAYSIHSRPAAGLYSETHKWNSHNHILFLRFLSYEIQVLYRISFLQDCEEYIALTATLFAWELASRNARLQEIWCQFSYRLSQYLPSWTSTELSYDRRSPPSRKYSSRRDVCNCSDRTSFPLCGRYIHCHCHGGHRGPKLWDIQHLSTNIEY